MSHYMTCSGLLMLVIGLAAARLLFETHDRLWAALVLPALVVALTLTSPVARGLARASGSACSSR